MGDVSAVYMGQKDGKFAVNVKPNNVPAGNLGGAGVVKMFDSQEDAQAFMAAINNNNLSQPTEDAFVRTADSPEVKGFVREGVKKDDIAKIRAEMG